MTPLDRRLTRLEAAAGTRPPVPCPTCARWPGTVFREASADPLLTPDVWRVHFDTCPRCGRKPLVVVLHLPPEEPN
jgi:hypothetical protein